MRRDNADLIATLCGQIRRTRWLNRQDNLLKHVYAIAQMLDSFLERHLPLSVGAHENDLEACKKDFATISACLTTEMYEIKRLQDLVYVRSCFAVFVEAIFHAGTEEVFWRETEKGLVLIEQYFSDYCLSTETHFELLGEYCRLARTRKSKRALIQDLDMVSHLVVLTSAQGITTRESNMKTPYILAKSIRRTIETIEPFSTAKSASTHLSADQKACQSTSTRYMVEVCSNLETTLADIQNLPAKDGKLIIKPVLKRHYSSFRGIRVS